MSAPHHPPRHCFARCRYSIGGQQLFLYFTDGSFYYYPDFSNADWFALKTELTHGTKFNSAFRRYSKDHIGYLANPDFTITADDEFVN